MPTSINSLLRERGLTPKEVTLWLAITPEEVSHSCMFCKQTLFKSQMRAVVVLYGSVSDMPFLLPPISIQCHKCGCIYHLDGMAG